MDCSDADMLQHWQQECKDEYGISDLLLLPQLTNNIGMAVQSGICFYNVS